jgi:hypothetical protein
MEIKTARKLYHEFKTLDDYQAKFNMPFPIGVFGTLRQLPNDQGNARRMFTRQPVAHHKAFLPHFTSSGIWLDFKEGASGVLELYYYEPEDFPAVIERVDALEGFSPDHSYGYWRTLMEVKVLPEDYTHELFNEGIHADDRDLKIPEDKWDFPCVPAWVYSNARSNHACQQCFSGDTDIFGPKRGVYDSPILWWH